MYGKPGSQITYLMKDAGCHFNSKSIFVYKYCNSDDNLAKILKGLILVVVVKYDTITKNARNDHRLCPDNTKLDVSKFGSDSQYIRCRWLILEYLHFLFFLQIENMVW